MPRCYHCRRPLTRHEPNRILPSLTWLCIRCWIWYDGRLFPEARKRSRLHA